jgi:hypothetical protein
LEDLPIGIWPLARKTKSNLGLDGHGACICNSFMHSTDIYRSLLGQGVYFIFPAWALVLPMSIFCAVTLIQGNIALKEVISSFAGFEIAALVLSFLPNHNRLSWFCFTLFHHLFSEH